MKAARDRCIAVAHGDAPSALLLGPPGIGKTHLLAATMHEFGPQRAIYWTVAGFMDWVREMAYGRDMGIRSVIGCYLTGDFLLAFDELGRQKRSEWAEETLFRVLDERAANELPTVIAGNVSSKEIDPALLSRYIDGAIGCKGVDVRGQLR